MLVRPHNSTVNWLLCLAVESRMLVFVPRQMRSHAHLSRVFVSATNLKSYQSCHTVHMCTLVCLFMFTRPFKSDELHATRSSAFCGDLDESDMNLGTGTMLGSNTIRPGLDGDLNLESSTRRESTSDTIRLVMPSGRRQQTANKEELIDTSETVPSQ